MVNYLSCFIPKVSQITAPLGALLKKDGQWVWYHEQCLNKIKQLLTNKPVLQFYEVHQLTTMQVDAFQHGLGACLLQEGHSIACESRSLTKAEQHYAQIEEELPAIVYVLKDSTAIHMVQTLMSKMTINH